MVLGYRHKFKEDLLAALRKRQTELQQLPPCCSTDQEKSNLFKDCVSNLQRDIEFLSNGTYHMVPMMPSIKHEASELRLLARVYELLDLHQQKIRGRFNEFHKKEFRDEVLQMVSQDHGIHLPNIFNFAYIYKFIQAEIKLLTASCTDLVEKVSLICCNTVSFFIQQHFKRFKRVADAVTERCREEFEAIHDQTMAELAAMIAAESSHYYLSTGSENEYLFVLKLLSDTGDLN